MKVLWFCPAGLARSLAPPGTATPSRPGRHGRPDSIMPISIHCCHDEDPHVPLWPEPPGCADDLRAAYPPQVGQPRGRRLGFVLECTVTTAGALPRCSVIREGKAQGAPNRPDGQGARSALSPGSPMDSRQQHQRRTHSDPGYLYAACSTSTQPASGAPLAKRANVFALMAPLPDRAEGAPRGNPAAIEAKARPVVASAKRRFVPTSPVLNNLGVKQDFLYQHAKESHHAKEPYREIEPETGRHLAPGQRNLRD